MRDRPAAASRAPGRSTASAEPSAKAVRAQPRRVWWARARRARAARSARARRRGSRERPSAPAGWLLYGGEASAPSCWAWKSAQPLGLGGPEREALDAGDQRLCGVKSREGSDSSARVRGRCPEGRRADRARPLPHPGRLSGPARASARPCGSPVGGRRRRWRRAWRPACGRCSAPRSAARFWLSGGRRRRDRRCGCGRGPA
jgi:hypothetical protein